MYQNCYNIKYKWTDNWAFRQMSIIGLSEGGDEEERGDVRGDKRHNHCARLTHDKVNIERKMDLEIVD